MHVRGQIGLAASSPVTLGGIPQSSGLQLGECHMRPYALSSGAARRNGHAYKTLSSHLLWVRPSQVAAGCTNIYVPRTKDLADEQPQFN